jgi:hypothetical protein
VTFDAELYLRVTGEKMLLDGADPNRSPWDSRIVEAARALAAVGAIDAEGAQMIVDDYGLAIALRHEDQFRHRAISQRHARHIAGPSTPSPLKPRRVIACDRVIEHSAGMLRIRSVSLGEDDTSVAAKLRAAAPRPKRASRMIMRGGPWGAGGPPVITLGDDRGTTATAHFSGGGSDQEWTGRFTADQPLAQDTAWIDIDGERLELSEETPAIEVRVESLPEEDPAMHYLWRQVATPRHFHRPPESLEVAIDALVAARALAADNPALEDLRTVLGTLQHGSAPALGNRRVPDPWQSLLAGRSRGAGPTGTVTVGAVTPEFAGISLAVLNLESSDDGFEIEVETTADLMRMPFDSNVEQTSLAWWAADDRGNYYLGQIGSWSGGNGHGAGEVEFWPPLDRKARRLELMPTATMVRAVINVPLQWTGGSPVPEDKP